MPSSWSFRRISAGRVLTFVVLALVAVTMLYPFWFMVSSSFRSQLQYDIGRAGISLASWHLLFQLLPVGHELADSAIVTFSTILFILTLATTGGYAFSKLRYPGADWVFLAILGSMMIPVQSLVIPEYINLANAGLVDHYIGAILVYTALYAPFATFLMTMYFRGIPDELVQAALVDGLGYGGIFLRVILPLAVPAMATIVVLEFIGVWNDFLVGLLFLQNPAVRTITVGLATLNSQHMANVPVTMAGSLVSVVPEAIIYFIFQRYLISGLTMGMGK